MTTRTVTQNKAKWDDMGSIYARLDACQHVFYYSLVHILQPPKAKHILDVGCGSGRLISLALNLKSIECTYTAVDLSSAMLQLAEDHLEEEIHQLGVKMGLKEWMSKQRLELRLCDGELPI